MIKETAYCIEEILEPHIPSHYSIGKEVNYGNIIYVYVQRIGKTAIFNIISVNF